MAWSVAPASWSKDWEQADGALRDDGEDGGVMAV